MLSDRFLTAYIDLPFLEKLFRNKPNDIDARPDNTWPEVWQSLFRFLQRSAKIVVGADKDTVKSQSNLAGFLFNGGYSRHVEFQPDLLEQYRTPDKARPSDPFSVFLFESDTIPIQRLQARKGLLFLQHDDLETKWPKLFQEHVINVLPEEEESFTWSDLRHHAIPLNAIVIADKFAYRQFRDKPFGENLGTLLQQILPEGPIDSPFHFTLVTDLQTPYENGGPDPNEIYDRLYERINQFRPDIKLRATVASYNVGAGHKDRFIFTNYGTFSSNHSFHFFDEEGDLKKETLVTYHPNSTQGEDVAKPRLRRLYDLCNDPVEYGGNDGDDKTLLASGSNKNRLLEEVSSDE